MMQLGCFEFDGRMSTEFGLLIDPELSFSSPKVKGEYIEVPGRDGESFYTEGKLSNVSKSFPVYLPNKNLEVVSTEISNWLK